jgi:hypothetical protein
MKNYITLIVVLLAGIFIGAGSVWFVSYLPVENVQKNQVSISSVLTYSNIKISDSNFSCEGRFEKTVGSVIGELLEYNQKQSRNRLSYHCSGNICELSTSSCNPWQSSECGATILSFKVNSEKTIETDSFRCIDVP